MAHLPDDLGPDLGFYIIYIYIYRCNVLAYIRRVCIYIYKNTNDFRTFIDICGLSAHIYIHTTIYLDIKVFKTTYLNINISSYLYIYIFIP